MILVHELLKSIGKLIGGVQEPRVIDIKFNRSQLIKQMEYHQLFPWLIHFQNELSEICEIPQSVYSIAERVKMTNMARLMEYEHWLKQFQESSDIPIMVIKGILTANKLYPEVSLRTFADLDFLVRPTDFVKLDSYLKDHQYEPYNELYDQFPLETMLKYDFARHYINPARPKLAIDVHLNLSNKLHPFQFPQDDLWKNRTFYTINDFRIPGLSPEYQAVYYLYHSFKHYYFKWCWFIDCFFALDKQMNTKKFMTLVKQFELTKMLRMFMAVSETFFGRLPKIFEQDELAGIMPLEAKWLTVEEISVDKRPRSQSVNRIWLSAKYQQNIFSTFLYLLRQVFPPRDTQIIAETQKNVGLLRYLGRRLRQVFSFLRHRKDSNQG